MENGADAVVVPEWVEPEIIETDKESLNIIKEMPSTLVSELDRLASELSEETVETPTKRRGRGRPKKSEGTPVKNGSPAPAAGTPRERAKQRKRAAAVLANGNDAAIAEETGNGVQEPQALEQEVIDGNGTVEEGEEKTAEIGENNGEGKEEDADAPTAKKAKVEDEETKKGELGKQNGVWSYVSNCVVS